MKRWIIPVFCLALVLGPAMALSCPNCTGTVANSDAQAQTNVSWGFNLSVYVMLGGFFLVTGLVVGGVVKAAQSGSHTTRGRGFSVLPVSESKKI
jgi:heme/copper-type cytochrome/quinol oxidase subunit 2